MVAKTKESSKALSPISQLADWARQGIESFAAAQKALVDVVSTRRHAPATRHPINKPHPRTSGRKAAKVATS